ncbi:MAG: hypothetical protein PVSMB4_17510 [Ktedonobacterales bacterium]
MSTASSWGTATILSALSMGELRANALDWLDLRRSVSLPPHTEGYVGSGLRSDATVSLSR